MNRRGFLGSLLGAAFALDPERALWVPGKKLISIPPPLSVGDLHARYINPAIKALVEKFDAEFRIRIIRRYDPDRAQWVKRIDGLWGLPAQK